MTENAAAPAGLGPELIDSFAKLKTAIDVQVAATKRDLAQWLDQKPGPKDSTVIRIALLETALDRYLAERAATAPRLAAADADAHDMMQAVLRRAVQRRRATLHMNRSANTRAAGDPAGDEECANRLADTLNFLDTLAGRVPDHLVSREELASASEVLALLLGWFAGGIDETPGARKASR
jgi:hypothetical protein